MNSKEFSLLDFDLCDSEKAGSPLARESSSPKHGRCERLIVSIAASAGTGKTTTTTAIILRMIVAGRDIEKVAALTYTKVAAEEMRLRVRAGLTVLHQQLSQKANRESDGDDDGDGDTSPQLSASLLKELPTLPQLLKICEKVGWQTARKRIATARHKTGQAMFATIHSFADSLVSTFGYAIGVYEQIKEVDESSENALKEKLIAKAWAKHFYTPKGKPSCVLYAAMAYDKQSKFCVADYKSFKNIILAVLNDLSCSVHVVFPDWIFPDTTKSSLDYTQVCRLQNQHLDELQKEFVCSVQKSRDKAATANGMASDADTQTELKCITDFMQLHFSKIDFLLNLKVATVAEEVKNQFARVRQENRLNSFNDSLTNLNKLSQNRSITDSFYNTYQVLLIDEAQDCNAFQFNALFELFSHRRQTIIIVGDEKQSIYSFQDADVDQYLKFVGMANHRFHLSTNYRTSPQLLSALNEVYRLASNPYLKERQNSSEKTQETSAIQTSVDKAVSNQAHKPKKPQQEQATAKETSTKDSKDASHSFFLDLFPYEKLLKYPPAVAAKNTTSATTTTTVEKHEHESSKQESAKNSDSFSNNASSTYPLIKICGGSKINHQKINKDSVLQLLCSEISTLVANKSTSKDTIAVLLSSNIKINELSQQLQQWNIPHHIKNEKGNNSVLDSTSYDLVKKVLEVLLADNKIDSQAALKSCLASMLFAVKRHFLQDALQKAAPKFERMKKLLASNGASVALMALLSAEGIEESSQSMPKTIAENLLMHENGEAMLSNYKQIAQLYAKAENHKKVLSTRRFSYEAATVSISAELEEAKKSMAETAFDETLFPRFRQQIETLPVLLTLHGAKGLEFDHVLLYFSKSGTSNQRAIPRRLIEQGHATSPQGTGNREKSASTLEPPAELDPKSPTKPKINVAFLQTEKSVLISKETRKKHKQAIERFEKFEEGARRLYVGLTRAKKSITAIVVTNKNSNVSQALLAENPIFPLVVPQAIPEKKIYFETQIKKNFARINAVLVEKNDDRLFDPTCTQSPLQYALFTEDEIKAMQKLAQQNSVSPEKQSAKKNEQTLATDEKVEPPLKIGTVLAEGYIESFTSLKKKIESALKPASDTKAKAPSKNILQTNVVESSPAQQWRDHHIDRVLANAYDEESGEDSRDHDTETSDTAQQAEINQQAALAAQIETHELTQQDTTDPSGVDIDELPASDKGKAIADVSQKKASQQSFSFATMESNKKVGSLFHKIMQDISFSQCPFPEEVESDNASANTLLELSRRSLQQNGIDQRFAKGLAQLVASVLHTPLLHGDRKAFCLAQLQPFEVLKEETFFLPTSASQTTLRKRLADFVSHRDAQRAAKINSKELFPTSAHAETPLKDFSANSGHIKGEIDLVFFHDQRYYLLDWKTNRLGDTLESYSSEKLQHIMLQEKYHLQHALYLLALDRFLQARLAEKYHYETHFGGVFYIFVRGIAPIAASENSSGKTAKGVFQQNGVYFTRPALTDVLAFKKIFI